MIGFRFSQQSLHVLVVQHGKIFKDEHLVSDLKTHILIKILDRLHDFVLGIGIHVIENLGSNANTIDI